MQLSLPQTCLPRQVRLTIRHPEWQTTATLDDTHKTFTLTPPEGIDINEVEVVADFLGVTGQPDPQFPTVTLKEKHVKQADDAGKSGDPNADESVHVDEHAAEPDTAAASVEAPVAGDAGPVSEAGHEQAADETVNEVVIDQATEVVVHHHEPGEHHKPRRPKHAK